MSVEQDVLKNYQQIGAVVKEYGYPNQYNQRILDAEDYRLYYKEEFGSYYLLTTRRIGNFFKPLYIVNYTDSELLSVVPGEEIEKNLCRKYL